MGAKVCSPCFLVGTRMERRERSAGFCRLAGNHGRRDDNASPAAGYFASELRKERKRFLMKTWKATLKRGFSLFLAFTMCLSMLQLTVLAVDESGDTGTANHIHHSEGGICTSY